DVDPRQQPACIRKKRNFARFRPTRARGSGLLVHPPGRCERPPERPARKRAVPGEKSRSNRSISIRAKLTLEDDLGWWSAEFRTAEDRTALDAELLLRC